MRFVDALIWFFFVLAILFVAWYILGKSPTLEQTILILILSLVITNSITTREVKVRLANIEAKFAALATDFKDHLKHHRK